MTATNLAVVTDIHHGADTFTKVGTAALGLLDEALTRAKALGVDAVIDGGDRISDVDAATDRRLEAEVADCFAAAGLPRYHVDGNHDRAFLTEAENTEALRCDKRPDTVDLGEVRLVFWRPDVTLTRTRGFSLTDGDLVHLSNLLNASEKRTILVSHVPLSGQSMLGNYWFEANQAHAAYAEQVAIRAVLAVAPCPIVAISGHVHWNSVTMVDHVPHLTIQSLSDRWHSMPHPAGAWAHLSADNQTLSIRVFGHDSFAAEVPFPQRRCLRVERLPRFTEINEDPVARYRLIEAEAGS
jgi:UDP-2,3-diacylglucosamine pyrophosphatase LpxH